MSSAALGGPTADPEAQSPWSCYSCRRRKIRCDRRNPCSYCSKNGFSCSFPSSGRMPTRRHDMMVSKDPRQRETDLLSRLRRLEGLVEGLGSQGVVGKPQQDPDSRVENHEQLETPDTILDETPRDKHSPSGDSDPPNQSFAKEYGRFLENKNGNMYVGNIFWAILCDELKIVRQSVEDIYTPESDPTDEQSTQPSSSTSQYPSFPWTHDYPFTKRMRPLPSQLPFIWEIFVERVDPFIKILYRPTGLAVIQDAKSRLDSLNPGTEALVLAISFAAIKALDDQEVMNSFGEPRDDLLARYAFGTEQSLARADFLHTTEIEVIQAFTIYLHITALNKGMGSVWSLSGLLIRTAEAVGLHRDSSHFPGISPFEAEMRRRLWWHICVLDSMVADCLASEVSISSGVFDTREPININDEDISPNMTEPPQPREGWTDATYSAMQCEIWYLGRHLQSMMSTIHPKPDNPVPSEQQMLIAIRDCKKSLAGKFFDHVEVGDRVALAVSISSMVNLYLDNLEFLVRHRDLFRETTSTNASRAEDQKQNLLACGLAWFEALASLNGCPSSQRWAWTFRGKIEWAAVFTVLLQLCTRSWGPTCERAWMYVLDNCRNVPVNPGKEMLYQPMGSMLATARRHRSEEIKRLQGLPDVVRQLGHLAGTPWPTPPEPRDTRGEGGSAGVSQTQVTAIEERLALETAVSSGQRILDVVDLSELDSLETLNWESVIWSDGQAEPSSVAPVNPAIDPMAAMGPEEGQQMGPDAFLTNTEWKAWNNVYGEGECFARLI